MLSCLEFRQARLAPAEPPDDAETAAILQAMRPPIGPFRDLRPTADAGSRHPPVGRYYLSRQAELALRHRELVIDRTTALCGAE